MAAVLACAPLPTLSAQGPATADTITGRVVAADSTPIAQAEVRLAVEGQREQVTRTGLEGRYQLVVSGGSGSYVITASAFGYLPFSVGVERTPGSARITRDLRLSARPVSLDTMMVVTLRPDRDRPTAAERGARWSALSSEGFPVDPGDFADIGALLPGVTRVGSEGAGLSIAGQSPDQNGAVVDGATYGGGSLPSEGVRRVGIFTNSYDVSRGQFSGGQIAATTIAGTNLWGGSLTSHVDDPALRYGGAPEGLTGRIGRRLRLSAGGGGALVRDRLFVYGAVDLMHGDESITGLELLDSAGLRRLGIAPDSARRLIGIVSALGPTPPDSRLSPSGSRRFASALLRLDYTLTSQQSLTARLDWRGFDAFGLGSSPFRLFGAGGEQRTRNGGVLLQHAWARGGWAHELRAYRSVGHTGVGTDASVPSGVVHVLSTLDDGAAGAAVLTFGGNPFAPREERSLWEVGNELVISAAGGHVVRAGVMLQEERALAATSMGRAGIFTFHSLADLERGQAASFTRVITETPGEALRRYAALYVGDQWRPGERLSLVYGIRLDGSRYGRRPGLAAAVDSAFGAHGTRLPSEVVLSPRFGFRYDLPGSGGWALRGGAGIFAGVPPLQWVAARWNQTGEGVSTLLCVGPAAPAPEWRLYGADPATIPTSCADQSSVFSGAAPRVALYDPGFGAPRTWRTSVGASGKIATRWGMDVEALVVRGSHLASATDRNFLGESSFTLREEDDRPVYAGIHEIDPRTGRVAPAGSRVVPALGPVLELGSRGESWTGQVTTGVSGLFRRGSVSLHYTHTRSRILQGGIPGTGAASISTAGDPTRPEWIETPFSHRHHLQAILRSRLHRRLRVSVVGRLASGVPFTPFVQGDVNGDGYENDRAFVYDPASAPDPELGAALERLLVEAPGHVRSCLRRQAGRIASAGACRAPWSPSLDARAEILAIGNVNSRRLVLTLTASNVTAGLDHLLHGRDGLRGWGQYPVPDATLLRVSSFDAERRAFAYDVNPNFGRPLGRGSLRVPMRIALQGRVTLGADPRYQPMMHAIELGSGGARESIRANVARRIRNVPAVLLHLDAADTTVLGLSQMDRARLRALADSLAPEIAILVDSLTDVYTERGPFTPLRRARLHDLTHRAAALASAAVDRTRERLTPQQWSQVPAWLIRPASVEELEQHPSMEISLPGSGM